MGEWDKCDHRGACPYCGFRCVLHCGIARNHTEWRSMTWRSMTKARMMKRLEIVAFPGVSRVAKYPVGESNPCYRRERAASWASRRTGRRNSWQVHPSSISELALPFDADSNPKVFPGYPRCGNRDSSSGLSRCCQRACDDIAARAGGLVWPSNGVFPSETLVNPHPRVITQNPGIPGPR